jgi:hypothetical protein
MILILKKTILKDVDDQIFKCISNYETSKENLLFIEINYLNVHLSIIILL